LLGFAGLIAGMLLWVHVMRWVGLLYVSQAKDGGDFLGPPKRRLLWALPVFALLHPAPWLVGATAFVAFRAFRAGAASGWRWFFGGLILALLYMILMTLTAFARWRRARCTTN
jgi:hypothetical protein